jgi:DNA topoisomerase-2
MSLEEYKKKELSQQILDEPDTYVGGTDMIIDVLPVFKDGNIVVKDTQYIPAIIKLYDEILVNARDQKVRLDESKNKDIIGVSNIKVEFNPENQMWSIYNDGNGIDVALHPSEKDDKNKPIWIPGLILGELLTSKNYNKKGKTTGGKNGFGAKLVNLFSIWFQVETVDHTRGLKYVQEFKDNMSVKCKPKVTKVKGKPYTKISWIVDFKRFGIKKYNDDMIDMMIRRIYDISGTTDKNLNLYYNGEKLKTKSFQQYIKLYTGDNNIICECIDPRWEIGVTCSKTDKFEQYSFVNGIYTQKGGKHVDMIVKMITGKIAEHIKKKHKKEIPENYIKNYLKIFVNSIIEDPSFDSQSKERLITPMSKFGSKPEIDNKFIKKIVDNLDIVDKVLSFADFKLNKEAKKNDGQKVNRIRNIPKLDDANNAGTKKSNDCTLILTEGDSAKTMAISGLSVIGRDNYGVFPLKGKVLNVKDATQKQIIDNVEITNLIKILGLVRGKEYKNTNSLRYGKVMILADQDHDGSHIKGLVLNIFHTLWPSLLKSGYINSMLTPIVKVSKGKNMQSFYNLTDYENWKFKTGDYKKYNIKYYKGLGTSTAIESRDYFKSMKMNDYTWTDNSEDSMNLAFKKDLSDLRKGWLYGYNKNNIIEGKDKTIPIEKFINNELIHFSNSDTCRSIGSICDGLKPSQRKILYCAFKRKLYSEIRVAQLAGYVSENAAYHHGEASLQSTIIGLAQNFVGSNNINLLQPNGQFGTRIMGGHDSASPRYIHTELNPIVDLIFPSSDFDLLTYKNDDGILVEPEYYVPIVPMVLINGMKGIGTGFSTTIPQYNPIDVITNIMNKCNKKPYKSIHPWYKGFQGTIKRTNDNMYITKGKYNILSKNVLVITELPIGKWTQNYKDFLEGLVYDKTKKQKFYILDYIDHSTDDSVQFEIRVESEVLINIKCNVERHTDTIEDLFKLSSTLSLKNIHLYDSNATIKRYNNIYDMFDEYYYTRYSLYVKRKQYQLDVLKYKLEFNKSKMRFITDVIDDKIVVFKQKKNDIIERLKMLQYPLNIDKCLDMEYTIEKCKTGYNYLIQIPLYHLSEEKIDELSDEIEKLQHEYDLLNSKTVEQIWLYELKLLKNKL